VTIEQLQYPIGKFHVPDIISMEILSTWIEEIAAFPKQLSDEVSTLTEEQLDATYRPGGWSIRQVVHHCADSHMNSFIRIKLALTEDTPTIKPYDEGKWAELSDSSSMPIQASLDLLQGLHARWVVLLYLTDKVDFQREFFHPEQGRNIRMNEVIGFYAWHGQHHLAHIRMAKRGLISK
jgi:uncharacterized damage-inducible protein DinB